MVVTFQNMAFVCSRAVKGDKYVRLYNEYNVQVAGFEEVSDFTPFSIQGGDWELGVGDLVESTQYVGCYYRTVGEEKEWVNPPLETGVVYRTSERHNNRPVYAVAFNGYTYNKNDVVAEINIGLASDEMCIVDLSGAMYDDDSLSNYTYHPLDISIYTDIRTKNITIKSNKESATEYGLRTNMIMKFTKEI